MTTQQVISEIEKRVYELSNDEKETINELLLYHYCEPSAAAERIANELNVNYGCIYEIVVKLS